MNNEYCPGENFSAEIDVSELRRDFVNHTEVVGPARFGGAVKISGGVLDEVAHGIRSVNASGRGLRAKVVEDSLLSRGGDLISRAIPSGARIVHSAIHRGTEEPVVMWVEKYGSIRPLAVGAIKVKLTKLRSGQVVLKHSPVGMWTASAQRAIEIAGTVEVQLRIGRDAAGEQEIDQRALRPALRTWNKFEEGARRTRIASGATVGRSAKKNACFAENHACIRLGTVPAQRRLAD